MADMKKNQIDKEKLKSSIRLVKKQAAPMPEGGYTIGKSLIAAIRAMKEDPSEANRIHLTEELLKDDLRFFIPVGPKGGSVMLLQRRDGQRFAPAYTDISELGKNVSVPAGSPIRTASIFLYADLMEKDESINGIVINPHGDMMVVPRDTILQLKAVKEKTKPAKIRAVEKGFSNELTEGLQSTLAEIPEVTSCYICSAERGSGKTRKTGWMFIVGCEGGNRAEINEKILVAADALLKDGETAELIFADSEVGEELMKYGAPFYVKG